MLDVLLLFTVLSTAISVAALAVAWSALRYRRWPSASIAEAQDDITELFSLMTRTRASFKRLNARVSMSKAREAKAAPAGNVDNPEQDPDRPGALSELSRREGESAVEWKARARAIIHTSKVK